MSDNRKARKARLDTDRTAVPLTQITPVVKPGKVNWGSNVEGYEIHDIDPHRDDGMYVQLSNGRWVRKRT